MDVATDLATKPQIAGTNSNVTLLNHIDHWLSRFGVRRGRHRVTPGLYALGAPTESSPVFVSANYTLSFDALRSAARGIDAYILVLDTHGVNVWCAAGKGTFGTDEIVAKLEETKLEEIVGHRSLIVPQLGAPGVAAHEVKRRSGFNVKYGPVRAEDLREFLKIGKATPEMRKVEFRTTSRAVLVPVEAVHILLPVLVVNLGLFLAGIIGSFYNEVFAGILAGIMLFPLTLPWIPSRDFSSKGYIIGAVAALPILLRDLIGNQTSSAYMAAFGAVGSLLLVSAISAFLALNFTGSSTYTSRTGVKREMYRYIPSMAWSFGIGLILTIVMRIF